MPYLQVNARGNGQGHSLEQGVQQPQPLDLCECRDDVGVYQDDFLLRRSTSTPLFIDLTSSEITRTLIPRSLRISLNSMVVIPAISAHLLRVYSPDLYISMAAEVLRLGLLAKRVRSASLTTSDLLE